MLLQEIYHPIKQELINVEQVLRDSLRSSKYKSILEVSNYLLDAGGKRLRPALVLLSAKASHRTLFSCRTLVNIAAAIELIHMASLVHDDVIDHASLRHNKPTVNCKKGEDVAIALGDYLYSAAFELISTCDNRDVLQCISSATKAMCEGELLQVCERDNLDLLKDRYMTIVKKKTAALCAVSCRAGALISSFSKSLPEAMEGYGLNFGIAFQIVDDYLDLAGDEESLGKSAGQDIKEGEATLPLLNLLESLPLSGRKEIKILLASKKDKESLERIKSMLFNSQASIKTKKAAISFINLAKKRIRTISRSAYKESLLSLADFIMERGFNRPRQL